MSLGFRIATSTLGLNEAAITSFLVLQMDLSRDTQDATGTLGTRELCTFMVKCLLMNGTLSLDCGQEK